MRSNDAFGVGYTPAGTITTTPSAASEPKHVFDSLTFSWNVLDFGLSYVRAKQLSDQALIAQERRRKAVQNLTQDVRNAWWRVEAAQRLLPETDALLAELNRTAARAKLIESRKLLPPLQIVAYKRSLLDLEQQISARRQELALARLELAQLLNLRPGTEFAVAAVDRQGAVPPDLTASIEALEQIAVRNRPELREEGYRSRITDLEGTRQLLSLLPSLSLDVGTDYDANKYLVNNRWSSAGLNLSWNLMKVASLPSIKGNIQAAAKVDESRRLAITAAVLGQTRIASVRYHLLLQELAIWDDAVNDDVRIVGYLEASRQVGLETELELIRAKGRSLISKVNRDLVYANVQGAIGRLYNSIGLDALPKGAESQTPQALTMTLAKTIQEWEATNFAAKPDTVQIPVAVTPVVGLAKEDADAFTGAMQRILTLAKVATVERGQAASYRLESTVSMQAPGISGQPSSMTYKLLDNKGAVLFEGEQKSMLITPVTAEQWRALGEGAGYRVIEPVRMHLARTATGNQTLLNVPVLAPTSAPAPAPLPVYTDNVAFVSKIGEEVVEAQLDLMFELTLTRLPAAAARVTTAKASAEAIERGQNN
jgi:outer membrane protein TolC